MVSQNIGCIITAYKRPKNFPAQLAAIQGQSIPPKEILVWQNSGGGQDCKISVPAGIKHIYANPNLGVWPRFLSGLELSTDYVCVFDDDTIPGKRWFENCIQCMTLKRGLMGTVGVIFNSTNRSEGWTRVGWPSANMHMHEADIVGHSWFFERDWLRYYAYEPRHGASTCGEDYHFSVAIQKHLKLNTYVPPHPPEHKDLWGSLHGQTLGIDDVALWKIRPETQKKVVAHAAYIKAGWRPMCVRRNP